jgi:recombination protein RecA
MAKKKSTATAAETALKNLRGFSLGGAKFNSKGNIPTGHFLLDFAIHYGRNASTVDLSQIPEYDPKVPLGIPLGKLVEIFGEEGGGKSSLAYRVVGYAQKMGYNTSWIDSEHSFSEDLAKINGCDIESIIYPSSSLYAEEVLDLIIALCNAEKVPKIDDNGKEVLVDSPKVIVLDSVASLIPKARQEANSDQQFMALLPRILSDNLGKVATAASESGTLVIFINQLREKVGVMFGNPETSPGGRALKHLSSLRLKVTKRKNKDADIEIEDEDNGQMILIGRNSYVKIEKNRFAKPFSESFDIPIYFEPYFPGIEEIAFDVGRQTRLVNVRKGIYSWGDLKIEGRSNFITHIKENNLKNRFISEVKAKCIEMGNILPPELVQYEVGVEKIKEEKPIEEKDDGVPRKVSRGRPRKDSKDS